MSRLQVKVPFITMSSSMVIVLENESRNGNQIHSADLYGICIRKKTWNCIICIEDRAKNKKKTKPTITKSRDRWVGISLSSFHDRLEFSFCNGWKSL
jgi:molybdenum cofactor biosynthesis enzyme